MGAQDREWNTALRSDPELVHLDCQTNFYNLPLYSTLCSRVKVGERDGSFVVGIACGLGTALFSTFRFCCSLGDKRCGLCIRVLFGMRCGICVDGKWFQS